MNDFYDILSTSKDVMKTVEEYNGDRTLKYGFSGSVIHIHKDVDFSVLNSKKELPFVLYKNSHIVDIDIGEIGSLDMCSFFTNNFLYNCIIKALNTNTQIILGHTHPTFAERKLVYGPIFSRIRYSNYPINEIKELLIDDHYIYKFHLDNGLYLKYGGDYCDYYTLMKVFKPISTIGAIYTPSIDSLGLYLVFECGQIDCIRWDNI